LQNIKQRVQQGYQMMSPKDTPLSMWALMTNCWSEIPEHRPQFSDIIHEIDHPYDMFTSNGGYLSPMDL